MAVSMTDVDELRDLTPSAEMIEGLEYRAGNNSALDYEFESRLLALRTGLAVAGHLDRIATALERMADVREDGF